MIDAPFVVAHRAGNHTDLLAPALERADAIELDVHVFRGRVEVRHEKILWPTSKLWERWYLLPNDTHVPTMTEILTALDVLDPDVPLLVDLKCFTARAARKIRQAIPGDRPLIVSSRSWWVLRAFADRPNTIGLRSCGNKFQIRAVSLVPGLGSKTGAVVHQRLLDQAVIDRLLAKTPTIFSWALPTVERARQLFESGISAVIVDDLSLDWVDRT
jgi:glycerophosphoryl diester phosphodiesterase